MSMNAGIKNTRKNAGPSHQFFLDQWKGTRWHFVEFGEARCEKLWTQAEIMECGCGIVSVSDKRRSSELDRSEVWPLTRSPDGGAA